MIANNQQLKVPNPKEICDFCGEISLVKDMKKIIRMDSDVNLVCKDCVRDREEGINHDD